MSAPRSSAPSAAAASSPRGSLLLAWCNHAAAKYAVEHWHYSQRLPVGPLVKVGVWEHGQFIGCVLFGRGASYNLGQRYGLDQTEVCELVRVALTTHQTPVSRIVKIALRLLKEHCPGQRLVVSFADPAEGHAGSIYQAGGWIYTGETAPAWQFLHAGRWRHNRDVTSGAFGKPSVIADYSKLPRRLVPGKYRYLMPLDRAMRAQVASLALPYPKRAGSTQENAPGHQPGDGGSSPTSALDSEE